MSTQADAMAMQDGTMVHFRPRRSLMTLAGMISRNPTTAMPAKMNPATTHHVMLLRQGVLHCLHVHAIQLTAGQGARPVSIDLLL